MKVRIVYLRRARQDLLEIVAYIRRDDPGAADRWIERAERTLGRLQAFPKSGAPARDRRLAASAYRTVAMGDYLAFHVVRGEEVRVRRVLHGRRRYSPLLD